MRVDKERGMREGGSSTKLFFKENELVMWFGGIKCEEVRPSMEGHRKLPQNVYRVDYATDKVVGLDIGGGETQRFRNKSVSCEDINKLIRTGLTYGEFQQRKKINFEDL